MLPILLKNEDHNIRRGKKDLLLLNHWRIHLISVYDILSMSP